MSRQAEMDRTRQARSRTNMLIGAGVGVVLAVALVAFAALAMTPAPRAPAPAGGVAVGKPAPTPVAEVPAATAPAPAASPVRAPAPKVVPRKAARPVAGAPAKATASSPQNLAIAVGRAGYKPSELTAKAGSPITLRVGQGSGCASEFLIPSLKVDKDISAGPVTVSLGRLDPGTYQYSCGMGMITGRLVVR